MANLFEGLENLGLKGLSEVKLFDNDKDKANGQAKAAEAPKELLEEDFLFDKTFQCPICDQQFLVKTMRTGKAKLIKTDPDLRPVYGGIDTLKYDAITCSNCGYSALSRYFNVNPTSGQLHLIKEGLSSFSGLPLPDGKYSYDDAITRHRLALVCTVMKKGKTSEKAFTCLKLAWLFRGKREEAERLKTGTPEDIKTLIASEQEFLTNAYNGFIEAFSKENFPMCGMDEMTVTYLACNLAEELGKYEEALRLLERIIMSREAQGSIKQKASDLKEKIYAKMGKKV